MRIFMNFSVTCMLFTLLAGVSQGQNTTTLPNNYTLSIKVGSDRDSFTSFRVSLLNVGKDTPIPPNEVSRYSLVTFNRPKEILWASCADGYRLTKATSKTGTRVFGMDASDPTSNAGIEFSDGRNINTYNLTIFCSLAAAQTSRFEKGEADKYIGFRHSVPLPSEFEEAGGWDTSWNQVAMGVREVRKGRLRMAWLERTTRYDSSGTPYIEVLDVLLLPPRTPGQSLLYTICHMGGKSRSDILAIAENRPQDRRFFGLVRRAWRVNLARGKFEVLSPTGMRCEKMIDRG